MTETIGVAWRGEGSDPEDGGWVFDGGGSVGGYEAAYETGSREEALGLGVPEAVLDRYERDGGDYASAGLFSWLCDNDALFRH